VFTSPRRAAPIPKTRTASSLWAVLTAPSTPARSPMPRLSNLAPPRRTGASRCPVSHTVALRLVPALLSLTLVSCYRFPQISVHINVFEQAPPLSTSRQPPTASSYPRLVVRPTPALVSPGSPPSLRALENYYSVYDTTNARIGFATRA
jgi:hypothetical protein